MGGPLSLARSKVRTSVNAARLSHVLWAFPRGRVETHELIFGA